MTVSHHVFHRGSMALLVALIATTGFAPALTVSHVNPTTVINPATLPTSSIDKTFAPADAARVKATFQRYARIVRLRGRLNSNDLPPSYAKTIYGQTVDLRQLFIFTNAVQQALLREGQPGLTSGAANGRTQIAIKAEDLPQEIVGAPRPLLVAAAAPPPPPPPPIPAATSAPRPPGAAAPVATPSPVATCDPNALPKTNTAADAWKQVNAVATGKLDTGADIKRCDVSFEPQLDQAEVTDPIVPSATGIPIPISIPGVSYGGNYVHGAFNNSLELSNLSNESDLRMTSDLEAVVLNKSFPVLTITTMVKAPQTGNVASSLMIAVGKINTYTVSGTFNPDYDFDISPQQQISLIPDFRYRLFGAEFEVNCVGTVKVTGSLHANRYGAYVEARPEVHVMLNGGVSANYLFVTGTLSGELDLVDLNGDFGGIVAIIPDTTAHLYFPSRFRSNAPYVAIGRGFGSIQYSLLQHSSLTVKLRIAGFFTPVNVTVPITGGVAQTTLSWPSNWSATYVKLPLASPTPASSNTP
jgi:hypothetical protein